MKQYSYAQRPPHHTRSLWEERESNLDQDLGNQQTAWDGSGLQLEWWPSHQGNVAEGVDCVNDTKFVNMDTKSYRLWPTYKCLATEEQKNKFNHLDLFLRKQCQFSPFMASVDALLAMEANATQNQRSSWLAMKWKRPYSCNYVYVWITVSITLFRATNFYIQGSQVLEIHTSAQHPQ